MSRNQLHACRSKSDVHIPITSIKRLCVYTWYHTLDDMNEHECDRVHLCKCVCVCACVCVEELLSHCIPTGCGSVSRRWICLPYPVCRLGYAVSSRAGGLWRRLGEPLSLWRHKPLILFLNCFIIIIASSKHVLGSQEKILLWSFGRQSLVCSGQDQGQLLDSRSQSGRTRGQT